MNKRFWCIHRLDSKKRPIFCNFVIRYWQFGKLSHYLPKLMLGCHWRLTGDFDSVGMTSCKCLYIFVGVYDCNIIIITLSVVAIRSTGCVEGGYNTIKIFFINLAKHYLYFLSKFIFLMKDLQ